MSRPTKNYRLWKNSQTGYYYYKLPGGAWRSTGCTERTDAKNKAQEKWRAQETSKAKKRIKGSVGEYCEPYFDWDHCPRIANRRAEGKRIAPQHAHRQRRILKKYIQPDELMGKPLQKVIPDDIRAFRQRMIAKATPRVVNSIVTVLKTVFRDLVKRGIIQSDPTQIIGKIQYQKRESGIFTEAELKKLFPARGLGPWLDLQDYTCFLLTATCGLRRSEVLALCWRDVDFDNLEIHVRQAWKSDTELGESKWGQKRKIPLPQKAADRLKQLRKKSEHVLPDALAFHNPDGSRKGATWWTGRFKKAMKAAQIDAKKRNLTGHSFRHSLNTLLRAKGYSDEKIRAALGWTNPSTQAGYTYWQTDHLREQADLVDGLFK